VRLIIQRQSSLSSTASAAAATATAVSLSSSSNNRKKHQTQQEPLLDNVNEFPPMPDPTPLSELLTKRKSPSKPKETAATPPNTAVNTKFLSPKGANPNTTNIDDSIASKKRRILDIADPLFKGTVIEQGVMEQGSLPFSDDLRQKCVQLCATYSFTDVTSCLQDLYQRMVAYNLISTTTTSLSPNISQATTPAFTATLVHLCEPLLHQLQESHSQYSWVFMAPVDPVALGLQDYFHIITKPMDLGTVKQKLHFGMYSSIDHFASDVKLVFDNAMTYNPLGTDVHKWANDMKQTFVQHYHNLLSRLLVPTPTTATSGSFNDQ
jgi:hypothetical protein